MQLKLITVKYNGSKRSSLLTSRSTMTYICSDPWVEPPEDEDWDSEAPEVSDGVLLLLYAFNAICSDGS